MVIVRGMFVTILNDGYTYMTYTEMAKKLGLVQYRKGRVPRHNSTYRVINVLPHEFDEACLLAGIIDVTNGDEFIIQTKGLRVVHYHYDKQLEFDFSSPSSNGQDS